MKGDRIIQTQLFMAQAFGALADIVTNAKGYVLAEMPFAELPADPPRGTLACVNDSQALSGVVSGDGSYTVLVFFNGTNWVVIGG